MGPINRSIVEICALSVRSSPNRLIFSGEGITSLVVARTVGKILIYGLLVAAAAFFFVQFKGAYRDGDAVFASKIAAMQAEAGVGEEASLETIGGSTGAVETPPGIPGASANGIERPDETLTEEESALDAADVATASSISRPQHQGKSSSAIYLAGFIFCLLGLAIFGGWDLVTWFAARSSRLLGAEVEPADTTDPEYDAAEEEWAKGNHLEAINRLRQFLEKHPSEQYAAIRIAEIYEKDLRNHLAAALELEEVLTKRLPREKWGWTAIHLSNLYSGKLGQPDKALGVLQRIVGDYPETAAAKKARQRLGLPEPDEVAPAPVATTEVSVEDEVTNLPPGFRVKKR